MEESKELQGAYKIFRTVVYVSVLLEFFMYAFDPAVLDHWNGISTRQCSTTGTVSCAMCMTA